MQGGSGIPFLASSVLDYFSCGKCTGINVNMDDIPDPSLQIVLQKVTDLGGKIDAWGWYMRGFVLGGNLSIPDTTDIPTLRHYFSCPAYHYVESLPSAVLLPVAIDTLYFHHLRF